MRHALALSDMWAAVSMREGEGLWGCLVVEHSPKALFLLDHDRITGTTYLKVSVKCRFYSETPSASAFYFGCGYWGAAVKYLGLRGARCITDPSISVFYPRGPCL